MVNDLVSTGPPEAVSLLNIIAEAARNPDTNVASLQALLQMQREVIADQAKAEFNRDYAALQAKLPRIKKDGAVEYAADKNKPDGPKKKAFNYAKWESIDTIIRPLLLEFGFSLTFDTTPRAADGGGLVVTGTLLHRGGHSKSASIPLALENAGGKNNVQGMGSSFSYGKRYTTIMLLNIVFEGQDDDGYNAGLRFITDDKKQEIIKLLQETGADTLAYLRHLGVESLDQIEHKNVTAAINALVAKKKKMETKKNEGSTV